MSKGIACLVLLVAMTTPTGSAIGQTTSGPLAEYVAKHDPSFRWVKQREGQLGSASVAEIILTSQTWQGIVWKHRLYLVKPAKVAADTKQGVLWISGGRWHDAYENATAPLELPDKARLFLFIAEQLQAPLAVLEQVPFQPMFGGKVEDAIISLTFEKFLQTGDPQWPLLLPMVKSAVRAMDTVQALCQDQWSIQLDAFTVTGASKRGWTTWLTGVVDNRATAIAPMVIDVLNMQPQMQHQLDVWGSYSHKIHDYTERGLQEHLGSDAGQSLRAIVDPYSYRTALTQPKLIMIGTNDDYWPLDALNLYWNDLLGEKYILYVPNNGHGLNDFARVIGSLRALHERAAGRKVLPKLSWAFESDGSQLTLRVDPGAQPGKVQAWLASAERRDFRAARWETRPMQANGDRYVYQLARPASGYAALFGEVVYPNEGIPYYLSTNVRIVGSESAGAAGSTGESQ